MTKVGGAGGKLRQLNERLEGSRGKNRIAEIAASPIIAASAIEDAMNPVAT